MKPLLVLLFVVAVCSLPARAQLLNFDFSFYGDEIVNNSNVSVLGTVSGELIGLQNNATSGPSDVIITSAPAALGLSLPYDLANNGFTSGSVGLTVDNGEITAGGIFFFDNGYVDSFGLNQGLNALWINGLYLTNDGGLSAVTFSPVPEPSTDALLFCAMGALVLCSRRLRRG